MSDDAGTARYPSLDGRRAVVTGGASGIGAIIVKSLLRQGSRVAFIDVDDAAADRLCASSDVDGGTRPLYIKADVTDIAALQAAVKTAAAQLDGLSVLVNNVGNDTRHAPADVTEAFWRRTMAINLDAAFFASQAAMPFLVAAGGGSIINIGSIQTLLGSANMVGYVTAKSGLNGLTRALASDYGGNRVRVNTVTPGWVLTERQRTLWATPEAVAEWQAQSRLQGELMP